MGCAIEKQKDGGVMFICGPGVQACSVCGRLAVSLLAQEMGETGLGGPGQRERGGVNGRETYTIFHRNG
jgi:hypothetical protein